MNRPGRKKPSLAQGSLPIGWGRTVFSFFLLGSVVFLTSYDSLALNLGRKLAGDAPFLIGGGSDAIPVGCFSGNQPALLEQLVHKLSYELIPDLVVPVLVAQTADLKVLRYMYRNGIHDVEITAFCPALFQDIPRDLIPLCLQLRPICLVTQVLVLLIVVDVVAVKGSCLHQMLLQGLNVSFIYHSAEAAGVEVEILAILGHRVAAPVVSQGNRPPQLLEQAAAFLFEGGPIGVA